MKINYDLVMWKFDELLKHYSSLHWKAVSSLGRVFEWVEHVTYFHLSCVMPFHCIRDLHSSNDQHLQKQLCTTKHTTAFSNFHTANSVNISQTGWCWWIKFFIPNRYQSVLLKSRPVGRTLHYQWWLKGRTQPSGWSLKGCLSGNG